MFPAILIFVSGCHTVDYMPYEGAQQDWPTADGAFIKRLDGVEIIKGLPSKKYRVLGNLEIGQLSPQHYEGPVAYEVKARGGDAALILSKDLRNSGYVDAGGTSTTFFNGNNATTVGGGGFSAAVDHLNVTVWIIRYLDSPPLTSAELERIKQLETTPKRLDSPGSGHR